jgi:hypothetical protein
LLGIVVALICAVDLGRSRRDLQGVLPETLWLLRPSALGHVAQRQLRRIKLNVLDLFALPGVRDVRLAVGRADDGRVRKLAPLRFQVECRPPGAARLLDA